MRRRRRKKKERGKGARKLEKRRWPLSRIVVDGWIGSGLAGWKLQVFFRSRCLLALLGAAEFSPVDFGGVGGAFGLTGGL
jgi:hypothetical protein